MQHVRDKQCQGPMTLFMDRGAFDLSVLGPPKLIAYHFARRTDECLSGLLMLRMTTPVAYQDVRFKPPRRMSAYEHLSPPRAFVRVVRLRHLCIDTTTK